MARSDRNSQRDRKDLTPQVIVQLEFYDFQGVSVLNIKGLRNPIHEKELLIQKALANNSSLNGLIILKIFYSDGSCETEKLGFLRR